MEDVLDDPSLKQNFAFTTFSQASLQCGMTWHQPISYFPLTSGRCCSVNKRAKCLVVMPSVSSLCWSSDSAGSGTNELHGDFLRCMKNEKPEILRFRFQITLSIL